MSNENSRPNSVPVLISRGGQDGTATIRTDKQRLASLKGAVGSGERVYIPLVTLEESPDGHVRAGETFEYSADSFVCIAQLCLADDGSDSFAAQQIPPPTRVIGMLVERVPGDDVLDPPADHTSITIDTQGTNPSISIESKMEGADGTTMSMGVPSVLAATPPDQVPVYEVELVGRKTHEIRSHKISVLFKWGGADEQQQAVSFPRTRNKPDVEIAQTIQIWLEVVPPSTQLVELPTTYGIIVKIRKPPSRRGPTHLLVG